MQTPQARTDHLEVVRPAEVAVWDAQLVVRKFHGDGAFDPDAVPFEVTKPAHNLLMTNGVNQLWQIVTGQGGTLFNGTNAYIGVGDSTTTANANQTDLQAATNKLRKQVASAPTISSNVVTFTASFATSDANFSWAEVGVFNASSGGTMLNRFVTSLGTKTTSASWSVNVAVTIA